MNDDLFTQDSEIAVLSILLRYPERIYDLHNLKDFMFSSEPNSAIFAIIQELQEQKSVPNINLIASLMKSRNTEAKVGGKEYLDYLYKQGYDPENIKDFERLVVNTYKARQVIKISSYIPKNLSVDGIDSLIGDVRQRLDSLSENSGGETTSPLSLVLKESWEDIKVRITNPGIRGVTTGIKGLDKMTSGMNEGDEWIIAGRPSMGKSALLLNMSLSQGRYNVPHLIFSLEMTKRKLVERMIAISTGIDSTNLRLGYLDNDQMGQISECVKLIKDYPIHIDSNYEMNMGYITSTARKYKKLYDIKVVYLDYVQLLAERTSEATNELGRISRGLKLLANELGITVVLLSQLNRGVEMRDDKHPIMSDLRQSGNLEEDADLVMSLYREVQYNKNTKDPNLMELGILKQRDGKIGMVPVEFDNTTNRISEKW